MKEDSEDLFLLYNQAKGINSGVQGSADKVSFVLIQSNTHVHIIVTYPNFFCVVIDLKVTDVQQFGSTAQSWQLAELDAGEIFSKANWNNSGRDLVI